MAVDVRYRETLATDYEAIADLVNRSCPDQPALAAETIRWAVERVDPARPVVDLVAEVGGAVVGIAFLRGVPSVPGLLLNLTVASRLRRQGVGTRLLELATAAVAEQAYAVAIQVRETDAPMLGFLARHGFVERDRMFESVLDLTRFEPDAFADALRSAASKQIRFVSLAEADTPGLRRRLHQLANALDADVPSTEALEPITYEQWTGGWLGAPHSRPDLIVVGLDGEEPVAVSSIIVTPSGDAINYMSGVAAAYRGRGLGLAVKVEALRRAKAAGITEVLTENHTRNGPMLAINERLGYRRLPALIEFARQPRGRIGQQ